MTTKRVEALRLWEDEPKEEFILQHQDMAEDDRLLCGTCTRKWLFWPRRWFCLVACDEKSRELDDADIALRNQGVVKSEKGSVSYQEG